MRFIALRYFLETARLGSVRRASEILHVAPSAVSRQISLLEEDFGAPLFDRLGSGMRLNEAGEVFASQARDTIRDFERLRSDIDDLQQLRRGTIRISSMEGAVPGVLYRAIRRFAQDHPRVSFEIVVGGSEIQIVALARNEFDLSIVFDPPPHPDVLVECAVSDAICAIVHPHHALAARPSVRLSDLVGERLALLDHNFITRTRLERAAYDENVVLSGTVTINHILHTLAFARQQMGVAFAPIRIVQDEVAAGQLVAVPIDNPVLSGSRSAICRHRTRPLSRAAIAFLDVLKDELVRTDDAARPEAPSVL
jgi:DNA-binding transcriptional LysR family regulator